MRPDISTDISDMHAGFHDITKYINLGFEVLTIVKN